MWTENLKTIYPTLPHSLRGERGGYNKYPQIKKGFHGEKYKYFEVFGQNIYYVLYSAMSSLTL